MAEKSRQLHLYFARCNLLKITEILLRNVDVDKDTSKVLEKILWEGALHFKDEDINKGRSTLLQNCWQQSWIAIRLLHILHNRSSGLEGITGELDEALMLPRKEASFTSLLQFLELTPEDCKELQDLFSKVSLANLISRNKILPKLNNSTEEALLKSLIKNPGETYLLLELIACDHEAFTQIMEGIKELHTSAVMRCLRDLPDCDNVTRKKLTNVLYALLLLMPLDENEEMGRLLYSLSGTGDLEPYSLLSVTASQPNWFLYRFLDSCEDRHMLRHVDCTNSADIGSLNNVFSVITNNGRLCLKELCLRVISAKTHWVEELIGMATQLVMIQDQPKLEVLVSFSPLCPALAINLWKHLSSRADVLNIVNPIVDMCQKLYPDVFSTLQETMARLKVITDWLRHEGGTNLPDMNVMLSLTRNHSPLYVLQSTTHFVGLNHKSLLHLLLELEGSDSWNFRVFNGFLTMFAVFEILVKAVDIYNECEKEGINSESMCLRYKEEVSKPIMELNESLNQIEPLDFRLELLENMFFLLFLRSEDFCDDKCHDESSPDESEDIHKSLMRSVSDSVCAQEGLKSFSLPSPLHQKSASPYRTVSSSSYPSSSQRKYSAPQNRRDNKAPIKFSRGFVCYSWLVRDILSCIIEAVENCETICDNVDSVRLIRLRESVEDASWRLAMVSSSDRECIKNGSLDTYGSWDESWVYTKDDSSDSDTPSSTTSSPVRRTKRTKKAESESSSNTASGIKFSSSASSVKSKRNSKLFSTSSSLINLMLASPVSLVSYFIARDDLIRATKAVEKFNMKGCAIDVELNFLKEFSHLRKNLAEVQVKSVDDKPSVKDSTLQAISGSTSSGVLTVTITKLIETFFAVTPLPSEVCDSKGVVVLDLALCHSISLQHAACLLDLARNYFSSSPPTPIIGSFKAFTTSMRNTIEEAESCSSLQDIFLDPSIPVKASHVIKSLDIFWVTLMESLSGFQSALKSGDNDLADAAFLKLTSCAVTGQELVQNCQEEGKQHFLNQLRSFLACLWKVVSPNIPEGTKYHILDHSLENLIGELVFSQGKDPMDIEVALEPVALNVLHLVVANCAPFVTIKQLEQNPSTIVLNSYHDKTLQDCSPCQPDLVASLLTEILECIDFSRPETLHSTRIKVLLSNTCRLQQLEWSQLSGSGDQLFALLVNLHNLIWLHALISLEIPDQYGLLSPSSCLRDLSASCVGYIVGEGCFLSLAELRSSLAPSSTSASVSPLARKQMPVSPSSDPRALFLLANPYKLTPTVQVLPSRDMDKEVDTRMSAFISANVQISEDSVSVPMILYQYIDYVTLTQGTESEFTTSADSISNSSKEHLTDFLKEFFKREDIPEVIIQKEIGIPTGNCSDVEETSVENKKDTWKSREPRPEVLKFLAARNPLLSVVVEKIHCIERGVESVKTPTLTSALERQLMSQEATTLASLYDNNVMLATLESTVDSDKLWTWFDSAVQQQDWVACLDMLAILPEKQIKTDPRFVVFCDWILEQLCPSKDGWRYCQNITDPQKLCELTLANLEFWPLHGCITMLQVLLSVGTSLPLSVITKARQLETSMQTTRKVTKACALTSTDDAWAVVEELLKCDKVNLALQWFQQSDLIHAGHNSHTLLLIGQLVLELLEKGQEVSAQELLQQLPTDQAMRISEGLAVRAQSVSSLQQIVHFLQSREATPAQSLRYNYLDIGVHMLNYIPWQEQDGYRNLASQPELLVEQLLMSTRISTLEIILLNLQARLSTLPPGSPLSPPCLDALLRRYAAKAVDVRVRTKMLPPRQLLTPQMFAKFTPPDVPPTKQEWIGNDEVADCMCCEDTTFSMFNRRHHCRRCGRVVCGACSSQRIKVSGYGNVKVRICNDCYEYILPKMTHPDVMSGRSTRAESRDSEPEWWLTKDLVYNNTVREEFTYTHAPSVSLCLSILKLHSEHSSLLRFLFTTIETMLQLLRPICPGIINPEVDYSLLVTMIRSLLEFAKLSCSQHGSSSDWATVDGLFAEIDLLGMLVASPQTCALLPTEPLRGHSALSSLRENLLKSELWTLALEVSTKAGLDYNSVWVAWGKACLKAGAWTDARDKFAHCNPHKKDTQLLADILQILQDNPQITDLKSRLGRLKALSTKPEALHTSHSLEPRVYEECLYYLRTYGTYSSTLTFYLSQDDIKSAVCVLLEYPVEVQVYLDSLFLPALQSARVTQLYTCMADIDKSLVVFKEYLRASCAYCERYRLYNVLYQAQVWMNDHVRAAMTCIHFFKHNARSYHDLAAHKIHLETALGHLQLTLKNTKGSNLNDSSSSGLVMVVSKETIVHHISRVRLQLQVLAFVMSAGPETPAFTLFSSPAHQISLATSILVIGSDFEQSFSLAAKVADDWKLGKSAVLCSAAAQMAKEGKASDVQKLAALLEGETELCNQILIAALKERPPPPDADALIALITDVPSKITALIECGQLKSAYLLAVKQDRVNMEVDIRKILEAAVRLGQPLIRKICLKRLNIPDEEESN